MYFSRKSGNQKCNHILDSILVENVSQGILKESAECSDRTPPLSLKSFLSFTLLQRIPKHTNFCGESSLALKFHAIWAEFFNIEVSKSLLRERTKDGGGGFSVRKKQNEENSMQVPIISLVSSRMSAFSDQNNHLEARKTVHTCDIRNSIPLWWDVIGFSFFEFGAPQIRQKSKSRKSYVGTYHSVGNLLGIQIPNKQLARVLQKVVHSCDTLRQLFRPISS